MRNIAKYYNCKRNQLKNYIYKHNESVELSSYLSFSQRLLNLRLNSYFPLCFQLSRTIRVYDSGIIKIKFVLTRRNLQLKRYGVFNQCSIRYFQCMWFWH